MKKNYFLFATLLLMIFINKSYSQCDSLKPFVLIELYTSEGCSSCPTSEAGLNNLIKYEDDNNKNILAISELCAWFAGYKIYSPVGISRIGKYKTSISAFNGTPTNVVQGKLTGSGMTNVATRATSLYALPSAVGVCLELDTTLSNISTRTLKVNYEVTGSDSGQTLSVALMESGLVSVMTAGENAGKTLKHDNMCRLMSSVLLNKTNKKGTITFTYAANLVPANLRIGGFVQWFLDTNTDVLGGTKGFKLKDVVTLPAGVENKKTNPNRLTIIPNPNNGVFEINLSSNKPEDINMEIFSITGAPIYKESFKTELSLITKQIDISKYSQGSYFLKITSKDGVSNHIIIKQ